MKCDVCEKEVDPKEVHKIPFKLEPPLISCEDCMPFVVQAINKNHVQYLQSIIKIQQYALNAFEKYSLIDKIKEEQK